MMNRRELLWGGLAMAGGSLMLPYRSLAQGQARPPRRLIMLMARGGWDPVVTLDPKEAGPGVDIPPGEVFRRGQLDLYEAEGTDGAARSYFERHGDVTAVIRGLVVASVAHDACTRRILTGTPSAASPDMGAMNAAVGGSEFPLPYMVLGASAFSGPFAAQSGRVGSSNQIVTLLDDARAFPIEGGPRQRLVPTADEAGAMRAFLEGRVARLRARRGRFGANARRMDDYLASIATADRLVDFADVFGEVAPSRRFDQQVDVALDMLEQEVVWSVAMDTGMQWDTHTNNFADQIDNTVTFYAGLTRLLDGLKGRPGSMGGRLIDETAVVVVSEMGRTPTLNAEDGKDHWQVTTALVIGDDVPGERAFGKSTDVGAEGGVLQAEPIDFGTGQPSGAGRTLESADFVAGVLGWTGVDPERFLPNATPFMPWVS